MIYAELRIPLETIAGRISYSQFATGTPVNLRFPGQWYASESDLHQNWMRDYDPTTGRYIQADPLGLVDGASVYGYARQSPNRYTDPRGENAVIDFFVGSGSFSRALYRCTQYCLDPRAEKILWKFHEIIKDRPHLTQCLLAFAKQYTLANKAQISGRSAAGFSFNVLSRQGLKKATGKTPRSSTGLMTGVGLTALAA